VRRRSRGLVVLVGVFETVERAGEAADRLLMLAARDRHEVAGELEQQTLLGGRLEGAGLGADAVIEVADLDPSAWAILLSNRLQTLEALTYV